MFPGKSCFREIRELYHVAHNWMRKVRRRTRAFLRVDATTDSAHRTRALILLHALRHARPGSRTRFFRQSLAFISGPPSPSPAEPCKINTIQEFDAGYARLAAMLGRSEKTPAPGEHDFLQKVIKRKVYPGSIGVSDYLLLTAFISILAPLRVIEIGTLTGFSAAVIAAALRRQHGTNVAWVDTIDTQVNCAMDMNQATGFEIAELFPELAPMIRLHIPNDASFVGQICTPNELEVAFIDADHRHPFPLLDLLRLAPYVRGSGWVVLHDVELGTMMCGALNGGTPVPWNPIFGAEWLFQQWPFRKISGGNIGALQLPEDKCSLVPFALRMMSIPFETEQRRASHIRRKLYQSIAALY